VTLTQRLPLKTVFRSVAVYYGVSFLIILGLGIYIGILGQNKIQGPITLFCDVVSKGYKPPDWISRLSIVAKVSIVTLVLMQTATITSIIVSVVLIKRFFDNRGQEVDYL